ncbi:MAG: 3'-5' exonuclease [Kiritimatiellae bacterium]|nr:3'-5' exonuclease [Kiritimatiellia bacterium]
MEFVAIDFETTGYDCGCTNEPWQLGAVLTRDWEIVETREWFFDVEGAPERAHEADALGTLGSSFETWAPFLLGKRLVAHNLACEKTILTRVAPLTEWGPWVDTLPLAKARYPHLPSYKLGDLCEMFGCVPQMDGRTWHDGLYDAVACAMLAERLSR